MSYLFISGNRPNFLCTITLVIGFLFTQSAFAAVIAVDDAKSTTVGKQVIIAVLSNDDLGGASPSEAKVCTSANYIETCSAVDYSFSPPYHGSVSVVGNTVVYTPSEGYTGSDFFNYAVLVQKLNASPEYSVATVNITVTEEPISEERQQLIDAVGTLCGRESAPEDISAACAYFSDPEVSESDKALAYASLSGDQITAQTSSTVSLSRDQGANLSSRLEQLRGGVRGFSISGLSIQNSGERLNGDWLHAIYDTMSGGSAGEEPTSNNYAPFGYFVNGSISTGDKDETANERGYDLDSDSYTMGLDYRFSESLVAGFAYGYGAGEIDFTTAGDNIDNTSHNFTFYGSWYKEQFYLDAALGYATGEIETARRIIITDTIATGKTDTNQIMLQLAGSYDWTIGALSYGPYVRLDLIDGEIDSYGEQNGGGFELAFDKQDVSSQLATLGGQAQYALSYSWGVLMPSARFELKNEFVDDRDPIRGRFQLDPDNTQFDINADDVDNFWFQTGVGLSAIFTNGISAYVDYETAMGLANTSLSTYSFGGRWELAF